MTPADRSDSAALEFNPGTLVEPCRRLDEKRLSMIHLASMKILDEPGISCFNARAAEVFAAAGCRVEKEGAEGGVWRVRIPEHVVMEAVGRAPAKVVLGARDPANRLVLDAEVPRVYFGTGSETNIYLQSENRTFIPQGGGPSRRLPVYRRERGSLAFLCESARLCNALENVDFFIRNVNVQDEDLPPEHKDVNVFFASLLYFEGHVQAGIADLDRLDDVLAMAAAIAGGRERLKENPVVSFITCLVKSPLQMVEDTTDKLIAIAERGMPVVISSSPQGGSTAPIREEGMVALINAEILAGVALAQLVRPGTPILYGAVPVRARLDDLHDLYGAPEFIHYNVDCAEMARRYGLPCYSTAGVGDASEPGLQAVAEKLPAHLAVPQAGAQYIHYAFGLLEKTNVFSPLQAVIDDAHVGIVKEILRRPVFGEAEAAAAVAEVRKVMQSGSRLFARHVRKPLRQGLVSPPYPFESREGGDEVLARAQERLEEILAAPPNPLDGGMVQRIYADTEGLLPPRRFGVEA